MATKLFSKIKLGSLELSNRIIVAPMCQYSAVNGSMTDWHLMHLGQFAVAGAGLVFVEATGVEAAGRITPGCTGLYNDENEQAMERIVRFIKEYGNSKIGIQLAHAGRKASTAEPWNGAKGLSEQDGGWEISAPSPLPYGQGWLQPKELDPAGLSRVRAAFVQAAQRAERAGFEVIELHAAHGYLMHSFLSPLSNHRTDIYGGTLENRMRFPLEVFEEIRATVSKRIPIGVRVSATDWVDGGWNIQETIQFCHRLKEMGCDFMDISSGGNSPDQSIAVGPGYQVPFAAEVKAATGLATMAVGKITEPAQAETILATGQADMIALARGMLYDPRWPWHAAQVLGDQTAFPVQYQRCHPSLQGLPVPGNPPAAK